MQSTYSFSEDLARMERGAGPRALGIWKKLARGAVASSGAALADVEDLVQDLLVVLLALPARKPGAWAKLRAAEENLLRTWLAGRLRWLWLARLPDAPARKALRGAVRTALKSGLPHGSTPPESLRNGDRFSAALVGRAVAWAISTRAAKPGRLDEIVYALWERWGFEFMPVEAPAPLDSEQAARRALDAFGLAKVALRRLDPRDLRILGLYASGYGYEAIAADVGVAKSTVSRRIQFAAHLVRRGGFMGISTRRGAFEYVLMECRKQLGPVDFPGNFP